MQRFQFCPQNVWLAIDFGKIEKRNVIVFFLVVEDSPWEIFVSKFHFTQHLSKSNWKCLFCKEKIIKKIVFICKYINVHGDRLK